MTRTFGDAGAHMNLPALPTAASPAEDSPYKLVSTVEQMDALVAELEAAEMIAVDTETEGLLYPDVIVGLCFSTRPGTGYYVPVRHEEYDGLLYPNQLPAQYVFDRLRDVLQRVPCVGHNIKFDDKMLQKDGILCNFVADTLAIAKLFGKWMNNGLKFLVKELLHHVMADLASLFPKVGNKKSVIAPKILSPEEICHYAAEDANWTLQLYQFFIARMPAILQSNLYNIEMKLLPAVAEMELFGLPVDKGFLQEQGLVAREIIARLEVEIVAGIRTALNDPEYTISLTSPPQLAKLLFEDLKLPILETSELTGKPSTSKEVMQQLAEMDPITRSILTHRTLKKLNSTYLEGLVPKIYDDGRIRGNFNQFGTASGRFSSSEPNLQNLPRDQTFYLWEVSAEEKQMLLTEFPEMLQETEAKHENGVETLAGWQVYNKQKTRWENEGKVGTASNGTTYGVEDSIVKEMWKCKTRNFVAALPDHYLVEADYSQVELRIMAGESQEPTLLYAYANGLDVHMATGQMMYAVPDCGVVDCPGSDHPLCLVTKEQRQSGKTINFSLLYGAGAENIGKQLGISTEAAEKLVALYFEKFPNIGGWIEGVKRQAVQDRCAVTPFGRVRHFQYIHESPRGSNRKMVSKEQREAVNFMIQGAAADVMKFSFVRTAGRLRKYFGDKAKIVSTVHDSVLLEVHDSVSKDDIARVLNDAMAHPSFLEAIQTDQGREVKWPALQVDIKVGKAWADASEIEFPEDMTLPAVYSGGLPIVRTRQIATERDSGVAASDVVDVFTGEVTAAPKYSTRPIAWIIEVTKRLTEAQMSGLTDFLKSRNDPEAKGTVTVFLPREDGSVKETRLNGTFRLAMRDESELRIKMGSCTLRQELEDIDPDEVLSGIDFGL